MPIVCQVFGCVLKKRGLAKSPLSPHYPYWSVLSANRVLLGTETDGHTEVYHDQVSKKKLTVLTAINFYAKHLSASINREQSLLIDEALKQP